MAQGLHQYQCDKQHEHFHLECKIPGTNIACTSFAENYGPLLARILSDLLEQPPSKDTDILVLGLDEGEDAMDHIYYATVDSDSHKPKEMYENRLLKSEFGQNVVRYVERLHKNLGHPST